MTKRVLSNIVLIAYSAFLLKLMVFRNLLVKVGSLNYDVQPDAGHANIVPLKTIFSYLQGNHGLLNAIINVGGNIVLLVPVGFLTSFTYFRMTWQKAAIFSITTGFAIETLEVIFHSGIFDIDDIILNAFGVMVGYWIFIFLVEERFSRKPCFL